MKTHKLILQIILYFTLSLLLTGLTPLQAGAEGSEAANVQITQVDTSQFPQVTVYISVTDEDGEPLGVAPQEIRLLEDERLLSPDAFSGMGEVSDLTTLLVIDVSGSMNSGGKLAAAKAAAAAYIQQMRPGDRAGLLAFNTNIDLVQGVTGDTRSLTDAIYSLKAREDTMMYDALFEAVAVLEPFKGRKAIIVLTDGLDNRSTHTPEEVVEQIGPAGLSISTVGLGNPTHGKGAQTALDEEALTMLAESAGGVYGYASDEESLLSLYALYGRTLQAEYQISYTSPATVRDGINRSLTVYVDSIPVDVGMEEYNPGGLVPETGQPVSWSLFLALLAGLLSLLALPEVVRFGLKRLGKGERRPTQVKATRVKLKD